MRWWWVSAVLCGCSAIGPAELEDALAGAIGVDAQLDRGLGVLDRCSTDNLRVSVANPFAGRTFDVVVLVDGSPIERLEVEFPPSAGRSVASIAFDGTRVPRKPAGPYAIELELTQGSAGFDVVSVGSFDDETPTAFLDGDGDGYGDLVVDRCQEGSIATAGDCDDADHRIHPGATEAIGAAVDFDCDGLVFCYPDGDRDGSGSPVGELVQVPSVPGCVGSMDAAPDSLDCDDGDPDVHPGAPELVADGLDQDCDGQDLCYVDADQDGVGGQETHPAQVCSGIGISSSTGDCDDLDEHRTPGAPERCDGIDSDCNPLTGPAAGDELDADGDHFVTCGGFVDLGIGLEGGDDCDDEHAEAFPGNPMGQRCDGLDTNCAGQIPADEADADDDGYLACAPAVDVGLGLQGGDCDDLDGTVYPGALEICDGLDNDCLNGVPADEVDQDHDGYAACAHPVPGFPAEDCQPLDAAVHPGQVEICDGVRNDCGVEPPDRGALPFRVVQGHESLSVDTLAAAMATGVNPDSTVVHVCGEGGSGTDVFHVQVDTALIGHPYLSEAGELVRPSLTGTFEVTGGTFVVEALRLAPGPGVGGGASQGGVALIHTQATAQFRQVAIDCHGQSAIANGGAIYASGSLVVADSTIANCTAGVAGGAVASFGAIEIARTDFIGNTAGSGGGLRIGPSASPASLSDVAFVGNSAVDGGGVLIRRLGVTLTGGAFRDTLAGGALSVAADGAGVVSDVEFTGNVTTASGGAVRVVGSILLDQCTMSHNTAGVYGGAVYGTGTVAVTGGSYTDNSGASGGAFYLSGASVFQSVTVEQNTT